MITENKRHESLKQDECPPEKEKSENRNERSGNLTENRKPNDEKDSQSKLSKDPTRKNEAQQGESDLRTRID